MTKGLMNADLNQVGLGAGLVQSGGSVMVGGTSAVTFSGAVAANSGMTISGGGTIVDTGLVVNAGGVTVSAGEVVLTAAGGLTAHAGGGQTSATALPAQIIQVGTVATSLDSVLLPPAVVGDVRFFANDGTADMQIFATGTTDTIDGVAGATGVKCTAGKRGVAFVPAANKWITVVGTKSA